MEGREPHPPRLAHTGLQACSEKVGIRQPKAPRRTHASLLLLTGAHPKIVSQRLGQASVAFTLDTYSHVLPGIQEAAADRLDQLMTGTSSPTVVRGQ
jgi:integrase